MDTSLSISELYFPNKLSIKSHEVFSDALWSSLKMDLRAYKQVVCLNHVEIIIEIPSEEVLKSLITSLIDKYQNNILLSHCD